MLTVQELITRNDKMKATRAQYESLWQEIAEYMLPYRAQIGLQVSPGQKQTSKIYDSNAVDCVERWAAFIHGSLTSSAVRWFSLKSRHPTANQVKGIMDWQEEVVGVMYQNLRQSNFTAEMLPFYLDMGAFGTPCIYVAEKEFPDGKFRGLHFECFPNNSYSIAESHEGKVDTLFREFKLTARQAAQKFGTDKLPPRIQKQAEGDKRDEEATYLHCVFPSKEMQEKRPHPYTSVYLALDERQIIGDGGYWEFPFIVPRLLKTSGEIYGRGKGHAALPDVKTLNKTVEIGLKRDAKELDPPTMEIDQGVIGSVRQTPGGRTIVRSLDSIKELFSPNPARSQIQATREDRLIKSIRRIFNSDLIESFSAETTPNETATKSLIRWKLMQIVLGPSFGRIEAEGLNPLVERTFGILKRARQIPQAPAILQELGIRELDVEYEGAIARAQRMGEVEAISQYIQIGAQLAAIDPQAMDLIDVDEAMTVSAQVLGVPSKVIRSDAEVKNIRDARAQQMAAQQQKQDIAAIAEGAGKAAPALQAVGQMMEKANQGLPAEGLAQAGAPGAA